VETLDQAPVIVIAGSEAPRERVAALREAGVEVFLAPQGADPGERIRTALAALGHREVTSLLLEGGKTLAGAFATAGQIDESRTFVAPVLLGTTDPSPAPADPTFVTQRVTNVRRSPASERLEALATATERVGADTLITARFREW
jgi:diaminohydroxyphosphoribosylaminopyrimidine deaminase/5-amino-6-(5-phosphoribosylamino)uracil reductase